MKLREIANALGLTLLTPGLESRQDSEVTAGYCSDLLSDILANAASGSVAVTIQAHRNTIAVAVHAHLAAVIVPASRIPEPDVLECALEESIPVYSTPLSTFDVVGRLYELGLRGQASS